MNYRSKQRLAQDISKSLKKGRLHKTARNLLVTTIAASGAITGLLATPYTNSSTNVLAKVTKKAIKFEYGLVNKKVSVRNKKGKKLASKAIKKGKKVKLYGTKIIKGKKYYSIGHGRYLAAKYVTKAKIGTIKQSSNIFNSKAEQVGKTVLQTGKQVIVYGTKTIKGKKYYNLGNGKYVDAADVTLPGESNQANTDTNGGTNTSTTSGTSGSTGFTSNSTSTTSGTNSSTGSTANSTPTTSGTSGSTGSTSNSNSTSSGTNGSAGSTADNTSSSSGTNGSAGSIADNTSTSSGTNNSSTTVPNSSSGTSGTEASHSDVTSRGTLEVNQGEDVGSAEKAVTALPAGASAAWKAPVDTSKPGSQLAIVIVTYRDKSTKEIPILVNVKAPAAKPTEASQSKVAAKGNIEITQGNDVGAAANAVTALPTGANAAWKAPVDTSKVGPQLATVVVTFKDHSIKEITVLVDVKAPAAKPTEASQSKVAAKGNIEITQGNDVGAAANAITTLPTGASAAWKKTVDTSKIGIQIAYVVVSFKDHSIKEIPIAINVKANGKTEADMSSVAAGSPIKVARGTGVKYEQAKVALVGLPANATAIWQSKVDTSQVAPVLAVVKVTFHDGSTKEIDVIVNVIASKADTSDVSAKSLYEIKKGDPAIAADALTALPIGATAAWKDSVDTKTVGKKNAVVTVTYDDESKKDIKVVVLVKANVTVESKELATTFKPGLMAIVNSLDSLHNDLIAADWEAIKHDLQDALTNAHKFPLGWPGISAGIHAVNPVYNKLVDIAEILVTKKINNDLVTFLNGLQAVVTNTNSATIEQVNDLCGVFESYQGTNETMLKLKDVVTALHPGLDTVMDSLSQLNNDLTSKQYQNIVSNVNDFLVKTASLPATFTDAITSGSSILTAMYNDACAIVADLKNSKLDLSNLFSGLKTIKDSLTGNHLINLEDLNNQVENYTGSDDTLIKIRDLAKLLHQDLFDLKDEFAAIDTAAAGINLTDINAAFQDLMTQTDKMPASVGMTQDQYLSFVDWASSNPDTVESIYKDVAKILVPYTTQEINDQIIKIISSLQGINQKMDLSKQQELDAIYEALENGTFAWLNNLDKPAKANPAPHPVTPDHNATEAEQSDIASKGTIKIVQGGEIGNAADAVTALPAGATAAWEDSVDTRQVGPQIAIVIVTFKDGSTKEVPVLVEVIKPAAAPTEASQSTVTAKNNGLIQVKQGESVGSAADAVTALPADASAAWKTPVDTSKVGPQIAIVIVAFKDHSTKEITILVEVTSKPTEAETTTVSAKDSIQVEQGTSIGNAADALNNLPTDASAAWKMPVDTSKVGPQIAIIIVAFNDGSTKEVPVLVNVTARLTAADKSTVTANKPIEVAKGGTISDEMIRSSLSDLPSDAKVELITAVDTTQLGLIIATVKITFSDNSIKTIPVIVNVIAQGTTDADTSNVVAQGTVPAVHNVILADAEATKGLSSLPNGAKVKWKDPVNTSELGPQLAVVTVIFGDGSTKEITVLVNVVASQADTSNVQSNGTLTATRGRAIVDAFKAVTDLPDNATAAWKTSVDTSSAGLTTGIVTVTYSDGSTKDISITINVQDNLIVDVTDAAIAAKPGLTALYNKLVDLSSKLADGDHKTAKKDVDKLLQEMGNLPSTWTSGWEMLAPLSSVYNGLVTVAKDLVNIDANSDLTAIFSAMTTISSSIDSVKRIGLNNVLTAITNYTGNNSSLKILAALMKAWSPSLSKIFTALEAIQSHITSDQAQDVQTKFNSFVLQLKDLPHLSGSPVDIFTMGLYAKKFDIIYNLGSDILDDLKNAEPDIANLFKVIDQVKGNFTGDQVKELTELYTSSENYTGTDPTLKQVSGLATLLDPDATKLFSAARKIITSSAGADFASVATTYQEMMSEFAQLPKTANEKNPSTGKPYNSISIASDNLEAIKAIYNDMKAISRVFDAAGINSQAQTIQDSLVDIIDKLSTKEQILNDLYGALENGKLPFLSEL
ncbi:Rib/alpha-like domain-containing protein [Lactobacillus sp. ESL0785]|uniref:Rib/alpha-like domain-containing protein n=1 Tax=Lactobacillus sp. ESL0785 TaxID=2983232 RepID=UPI0023F7E307|nr:Rib/alpha-like domain-containing protein [Lactobacillus sp. ESL0785]WEV70756.1 Rib/alpha-like domain-containing protein [Lactobacillus sp. ESL0785]